MTKVLRILNRINLGGPVLNASFLTQYLPSNFISKLVVGTKEDDEEDAGFIAKKLGIEYTEVHEMKRSINWKLDRAAYRKVKNIIQQFKPDIVHTHAAKSGAIGRLAAKACGVPVIIHTFHGHVFHSYFGKWKTKFFIVFERYLAKISTGIIAISEQQKEELANTYKICSAEKITVIPNGFDLEKFGENQIEKRNKFRAAFQINDKEIVIGIVGRIVPVKNHLLFVSAAKQVIDNTNFPVKFIIIGDGDSRTEMEQKINKLGIDYVYYPSEPRAAQMICTSWQTEMDEVFAGLDIVALSSHNEGTPVSLIEAQAASKPLVSTNVGGVSDIVMNEQAGYITPPNDAPAFAQALIKLIEDPDLRNRFGAFGEAYVKTRFSYQRLVADMAAYYQLLLAKKRA